MKSKRRRQSTQNAKIRLFQQRLIIRTHTYYSHGQKLWNSERSKITSVSVSHFMAMTVPSLFTRAKIMKFMRNLLIFGGFFRVVLWAQNRIRQRSKTKYNDRHSHSSLWWKINEVKKHSQKNFIIQDFSKQTILLFNL